MFANGYIVAGDEAAQLVFALKYEGLDLLILKTFFQYAGDDFVRRMMDKEPTGQYARKVWFLYEWLLGEQIDIPDLKVGNHVEALNPKLHYAGPTTNSTRHRVKNNLPGTLDFCPLIRRTEKLEKIQVNSIS